MSSVTREARRIFFFLCCDTRPDLHSFPTHALPILRSEPARVSVGRGPPPAARADREGQEVTARIFADAAVDRKSTRLNSSHGYISYAVFCLKKKRRRHWTYWCCEPGILWVTREARR